MRRRADRIGCQKPHPSATRRTTNIDDQAQGETNLMIEHATSIVAAYLGNHNVMPDQIPAIIASVHAALTKLGGPADAVPAKLIPAISLRKSVQPDAIVCLDCGYSGKMLKRHLTTAHSLTPEQYRERWGLAPDYPVVAPNYAVKRSALAKQIGLGTMTPRGRRTLQSSVTLRGTR
jgi:predicted transcriptional regulator